MKSSSKLYVQFDALICQIDALISFPSLSQKVDYLHLPGFLLNCHRCLALTPIMPCHPLDSRCRDRQCIQASHVIRASICCHKVITAPKRENDPPKAIHYLKIKHHEVQSRRLLLLVARHIERDSRGMETRKASRLTETVYEKYRLQFLGAMLRQRMRGTMRLPISFDRT